MHPFTEPISTLTTAERAAADGRVNFLLDLGRALHESGLAAHQLEDLLALTSRRLGIEGQFFASPTSILAAFGSRHQQRTYMIRTVPEPPDLGRLARVSEIAEQVSKGVLNPRDASTELGKIDPTGGSPWALVIGYMLASSAAARIFGGGLREIEVAAIAGILTGTLALFVPTRPRFARIFEPVAAAVCAAFVALVGIVLRDFSVATATLAGVVVLIPGLVVTTAINELATQHLTAGTTRMASAFMTFVGIAFGWALGERVATLYGFPPNVAPTPLPEWTLWLSLLAAAIAFALLLRADKRDWPWIVVVAIVAMAASRLGTAMLGAELGSFVGAFAIGVFASLFSRFVRRPSATVLVPGLLVLVPGSTGFRGFLAMLQDNVVPGIGAGFTMILTAVALVAGLLTAAAVLPERTAD
jgi:uncharacterized membrane protein YjjP (DUF1212 family)